MDLSNLLNYYGIFSSLLVGIISVVGTYVVNKYNSKQNYKNSYKNMLIERKLRAIEALFKVMQNFTTVTDRDGWFSWMNHLEELDKILIDFKNIEKDLVWFPIQLGIKLHCLIITYAVIAGIYWKTITARILQRIKIRMLIILLSKGQKLKNSFMHFCRMKRMSSKCLRATATF